MGLNIIIVGAGIGGLSTAVALRKATHSVLILEKFSSRDDVGFALNTPPNCSRVLQSFGFDFKKARMTPWKGLDVVRADVSPLQWSQAPEIDAEKDYGAPSLCSHRVDLHNCLWDQAVGEGVGIPVKIREQTEVQLYDPLNGSVTLQTGETLKADLVVAADGVKSRAHEWVIGERYPATLSKLNAIRFAMTGEELSRIPESAQLLSKGAGKGTMFTGPEGRVGCYHSSCRDNEIHYFGVYTVREDEPSKEEPWRVSASRQMILETLRGFDERILEIVRQADENNMDLWKVPDRDPLSRFQRGRLVLVGDACHPMQSSMGQGASQAIEDAGVLGIVMEGVQDPSEVPARLELWESLRRPRVISAQLLSRTESVKFAVPEDTRKRVRLVVPEDILPDFTRSAVYDYFFKYNCLTEARLGVKSRFGGSTTTIGGYFLASLVGFWKKLLQ